MNDSNSDSSPQPVKEQSKWPRRLFWLGMLGLAFFVISWLEPDEQQLYELCATQGRPIIYRSVTADGYFYGATDNCWGCWNYLLNTDFKFIEFSISRQRPDFYPLSEPGSYRVSRIDSGSPECDQELTAYYKKTDYRRSELERNDSCLQLERLPARQARYGYYREGMGVVDRSPITGTSISSSRIYYLDHSSEEVLAQSTDYSLTKYPFFQVSSFRSRQSCNSFFASLGVRGLERQEVIMPSKEVRK